jgi:hypothetical protein
MIHLLLEVEWLAELETYTLNFTTVAKNYNTYQNGIVMFFNVLWQTPVNTDL